MKHKNESKKTKTENVKNSPHPENFYKVPWATAQMTKAVDRDLYLATNAKETFFYIILIICITVAAMGLTGNKDYFMAENLRVQIIAHSGKPYPEPEDTSQVNFHDISTIDEMWDYMGNHLFKLLYPDGFEASNQTDKGIGTENLLVGVPVIRQVMVTPICCPDPFPNFTQTCYPKYTKSSAFKKDLDETEWKYKSASETKSPHWNGRVAAYYGDGFQVELPRNFEEVNKTLQSLMNGKFIQNTTRAVFVDAAYYNPHVNLFTAVKIVFELPPTGGVIPTVNFFTWRMPRYTTARDFLVLACEIIYILLIAFYTVEEIREIIFLHKRYFFEFWNYVDLLLIGTAITLVTLQIIQHWSVFDVLMNATKNVEEHISLQQITIGEMYVRNATAAAVFVTYFKLFKFLNFNMAMDEIHRTLEKSLGDVGAFLVMFFIIFVGFGLFGSLCFGTQIWDFSTFPLSLFALSRMLLGDFTYDKLLEADPVISPLFFILFLAIVFFVLLNLFLAIIFDCYTDVKLESSTRPDKRHMTDFWKTGTYNLFHFCGCGICAPRALVTKHIHNKTEQELRIILKRCGFSDMDVEMFLSRYNIDPEAKIYTRDVEKLMEDFKFEFFQKTQEPPQIPLTVVESDKVGFKRGSENVGTRTPVVTPADFASQQQRLDKVEGVLAAIAYKLDLLLKKVIVIEARRS